MATTRPAYLNTLEEGLNFHTVDDLKKLLNLLPIQETPKRKAELIEAIAQHLLSVPKLKKIWKDLNELQQAVIAEAVHVNEGYYLPEQFQAKYDDLPEWESRTNRYRYNQPASTLDLFFYSFRNYDSVGHVLPDDLSEKLQAFVPEPKAITLESTDQPPESIQVEFRSYDYEARKRINTIEAVPVVCCPTEQAAQQDLLAVLRWCI
ncbi:MAG: hypothetical protein HC800_10195 [Phormidesmis sp. RL_2_1]|nr:hypothetical protein [Phormidesmis sp. RL_2_1]